MNIEKLREVLGTTPHMNRRQSDIITSFVKEHDFKNILELGFAHGVSTIYIANALKELNNGGKITTIDNLSAKTRSPNLEGFLMELKHIDNVTIFYEPTSYNWRLMKFIENNEEKFDFCYVDGAHNWFVDGLAFFLVEKLLTPGGWIVFDDMFWSYAASKSLASRVKDMPEDEKNTPHISKIFELLVKQHPNFENFSILDTWGFAQKKKD